MSWLFGIVSDNIKTNDIVKAKMLHPQPLFSYQSKNVYLASGGLKQTCLSSLANGNEQINQGWLVCGLGISSDVSANRHFMSAFDWSRIFSESEPKLALCDGHFAAITWHNDELSAYVDSRGLRELYITKQGKNILISTRLDWLCNYGSPYSLDLKRFGSRWLCPCQLSTDSIIHSITRLGPGGRAKISPSQWTLHLPHCVIPETGVDIPLDELIIQLTTFPLKTGYRVILCLSGGIDARILLAALLSRPKKEWALCILGSPTNPDVKISLTIARKLNLNYRYFEEDIPDVDTCLNLMEAFAAQTDCIAPATDAIRLKFYQNSYRPEEVLIDGGFGEMARGWLFNRLLIYGKKSYASGRLKDIIRYLRFNKASIFTEDALMLMTQGIEEDMAMLWEKLPHRNLQNFIDLLAICMFLPNRLGPEQSRIDNLTLSFMPFAQSSYLARILATEIAQRKHGRFLRRFILKNHLPLTYFPLVTILKESITYPFFLSNKIAIMGLAKIERLLGLSFRDQLNIKILKKLKPFILDTLSSDSTRTFGAYNLKVIEESARRFYQGNDSCADELSWWLTFELWRRALKLTI